LSCSQVAGSVYARWASVSLTLSGSWQGQTVVGNLKINGLTPNSTVSISQGTVYAKSPQVFLVE
jgi:hypothetical protein